MLSRALKEVEFGISICFVRSVVIHTSDRQRLMRHLGVVFGVSWDWRHRVDPERVILKET